MEALKDIGIALGACFVIFLMFSPFVFSSIRWRQDEYKEDDE